jgi:crotonobetainyl-CoA:carnitine CoA-transferase CaiB-like acyl-CoA transferase
MTGPLDGVKVVELGIWVAGPAAAGILADWGADVIKIEPPTGDPARSFQRMLGGDMASNPPFELDNRSKRSIAIDLSTEEGSAIALQLVDGADVFITNIRAAALDRIGMGPAQLRDRNPGLVYAIISGYGLDGPDADRPAYDIAAYWARSGLASLLTPPGGELPFQRGGMGDHSAAMTAAAMVSAALVARHRTGEGQVVSTSLLRQGAYTISFDLNVALMWGLSIGVGTRVSMRNPSINNYTAGDGRRFWIVGLEGDRHWPPLARVAGHPEWMNDPRFATGRARADNARALIAALDEVFATRSLEEWSKVFATEVDFFWAPVNTIDDLLADEQFHAGGGTVTVPDGEGGTPMVATPADFHGTPAAPRSLAPGVGEHTRAVLREMGFADHAIEDLVHRGAVGDGGGPPPA